MKIHLTVSTINKREATLLFATFINQVQSCASKKFCLQSFFITLTGSTTTLHFLDLALRSTSSHAVASFFSGWLTSSAVLRFTVGLLKTTHQPNRSVSISQRAK